jgi:hypothetical protein
VFSADENFDARFDVNFVVDYMGNVLQAPPAIVKSSCVIDITWFGIGFMGLIFLLRFPFDEQVTVYSKVV